MLGTALLCGKNKLLLDTRAGLLKTADIDSTIAMSVAEIRLIPSQVSFGLVVLGSSLTDDEISEVVPIVRRRWPDTKILIFNMLDQVREELQGCFYITTLEAPWEFIAKATELLTNAH